MIEMIQQYVLEFGSEILPRYTPFITSRDNKYFISSVGNQVISSCNHEYAGTRLVLQGSKVDSDVVVVCKDTVVYILMIWAYSKLNKTNTWYLKYDHEKFAFRKICTYLGEALSLPGWRPWQDAIPHLIFTESGRLKFNSKINWSTRFMFSIVRAWKLLYWKYQTNH